MQSLSFSITLTKAHSVFLLKKRSLYIYISFIFSPRVCLMINYQMPPVGFIHFHCLAEILKTAGQSGANQPEEEKIWKERHLSPVDRKCRYRTHIRLKQKSRTADVHRPRADCEPKKATAQCHGLAVTKHSGKRSQMQGHNSFIVNKWN